MFELVSNQIGYFGKMNSTLGSVVPLAMFKTFMWPLQSTFCLRHCKNGAQLSRELQLALTEKPLQVERIESLEDADEDEPALKVKSKTGAYRAISEKKTMSEELEELWEEVVEEILDTVNPEDDD